MRTEKSPIRIRLILSILLLCFVVVANTSAQRYKPIVFKGATLITGWDTKPIPDGYVVVGGPSVLFAGAEYDVVIPPLATIIDCKGKYIIPGMIDAYAKIRTVDDLRRMFALGVTTVNVLTAETDSLQELVRFSKGDSAAIPELLLTVPWYLKQQSHEEGDSSWNGMPGTPEEARRRIQRLARMGVSRISLIADIPNWCDGSFRTLSPLDSVVLSAMINEARKHNITLFLESPDRNEIRMALNTGMRGIVYGIINERIGSADVDQIQMLSANFFPLLSLLDLTADPKGFLTRILTDSYFQKAVPEVVFRRYTDSAYVAQYLEPCPDTNYFASQSQLVYDNCAAIIKSYTPIPLGTNMPDFPGIAAHLEIEDLVKAGVTPMQAIVSASGISAECLGLRKTHGFVYSKYKADFLVLDNDPVADIRNTRSVSMVVKRGIIYYPQDILQPIKK